MTGRRGAPKPPPEIWAELVEAGRTRDHTRFGIARAAYAAWCTDQGWDETPQGRPARADEAAR
jgi:hypothetical protein